MAGWFIYGAAQQAERCANKFERNHYRRIRRLLPKPLGFMITFPSFNAATITAWNNDNNNYMANASAIQSRLLNDLTMSGMGLPVSFNLLPGIEGRSNSDFTLGQP